MTFRFKLFFFSMCTALIATAVALSFLYYGGKKALYISLQKEAESAAISVASMIDTELFEEIKTRADEDKPPYKKLSSHFYTLVQQARAAGTNIKYVYALRPSKTHPNQVEFVLDSDQSTEQEHVGALAKSVNMDDLLQHRDHASSSPKFDPTPWGLLYSGYAPILSPQGKYIGTIGVDLYYSGFLKQSNILAIYWLIGFSVAFILLFIAFFLIANHFAKRIHALRHAATQISQGEKADLADNSSDELGDIADTLTHLKDKE